MQVGTEGGDTPGCLGHIQEPFEKEDMSDMFARALGEKMRQIDTIDRPKK